MTVKLPDGLRTAVNSKSDEPLVLLDELTQVSHVLVSADEFQRLKAAADADLEETYLAQIESAMQAGWGEARMDEYNDYDSHRSSKRDVKTVAHGNRTKRLGTHLPARGTEGR